jgi:Helix-turn-helix domain
MATLAEREEISRGIAQHVSAKRTAARIRCDPSVASREIAVSTTP